VRTIAIFVATTGGPAQIERLTPEFAPQSMVCLRRGSDILPISDDYDDFVKRGSGVIEREFGPFDYASFRMDVSESIGAGKSWQLGVFAAHAVTRSDQAELAGKESIPDVVVWLTGEVDYDLGVVSVGHLAEKIEASRAFFVKWFAAGVPVLVIVPEGNNKSEMMGSALLEGIEVTAVSSATEIFEQMELAVDTLDLPIKVRQKTPGKTWVILSVVVVLVLASWAIGSDRFSDLISTFKAPVVQNGVPNNRLKEMVLNSPTPSVAKPAAQQISQPKSIPTLRVLEQRPPAHATCAKVHFGQVKAEANEIKISKSDGIAISSKKNLCGLRFIFELGQTAQFIAVELIIKSGAFVRGNTKPTILSGTTKVQGQQIWSFDVPQRMAEPLQYRLTVIVGSEPTATELSWFKKQSDKKQAVETIAKKGFSVLTWRHKVAP